MAKKYSLAEIDQMRGLVSRLMEGQLHWRYSPGGFGCVSHGRRGNEPSQVEDRLRTYMANGTTLLELEAAAAELDRAEAAQMAESRAEYERGPPKASQPKVYANIRGY